MAAGLKVRDEVSMQGNLQLSNPHDWMNMGNVAVLQKWARQLKSLRDCVYDDGQWEMVGRFVMLVHPIKQYQVRLLKLVAEEAGYEFIEIDGASLIENVLADREFPVDAPALVYVPQGEWSALNDQGGVGSEKLAEFYEKLCVYLKRFASPRQIVLATTGVSYSEINSALRSVGCVDRRFIIPRPSFAEMGNAFIELVGRKRCANSLLDNPDRVGMLLSVEFEDQRRQGLLALGMQRAAHDQSRQLTYDDLVHFGVRGSADIDLVPERDDNMLKRVAIHEAGHALVAYFDSNGANVPDYITVLPGRGFRGVSVDSYAYMGEIHGKHSYEDSRHKIRVLLAGRAAESMVLGRTKIGTFGSRSDLINASAVAKELVGLCGFSDDIDFVDCTSKNLLVTEEDASPSEQSHVEGMARKYLAYQYEHVEKILQTTSGLLIQLSEELIKKQVLLQREVKQILTFGCA
ncbi:ATP-dependent zinc metalloprotease FtsH [Fluviibacter phosphoraccumulans]|uniref:ATP-dependent zinc metalloprotease FtsH n=2 Tax=Fluviibacter phosphoraccumulans TaxID=1751046 RepID=A0A679ICB7_9RHOO|nr:ATP-dependent zinc metalloprotease FtsH [Fluviibacter phosphoraccumulans]BBU72429.1 ATP-dependent zinc metalloprotease FtsH [Fluviibacter phosphoraccumulans]BCA66599.1 ATP-dependent zinc metalloprotease FtsH [Fluviibacter phosphoraccumulans]